MQLINLATLDLRNLPLRTKIKNAIKIIKLGASYNSYVIKADGRILKFEYNPARSKGYSVRTLQESDYIINKGPL